MVRRASVTPGEADSSREVCTRPSGARKRGLKIFGAFVVIALAFFLVTFMPYRSTNGMREMPLPMWVMLLPTLVSLGVGVIVGLVVTIVDRVRDRPSRRV